MEPTSILKAIKHCLPKKSGSPIPLHHPSFCGKEWEFEYVEFLFNKRTGL